MLWGAHRALWHARLTHRALRRPGLGHAWLTHRTRGLRLRSLLGRWQSLTGRHGARTGLLRLLGWVRLRGLLEMLGRLRLGHPGGLGDGCARHSLG